MKPITFKQFQIRVLTVLFILFSSTLIGYRYFVELPKLEQKITLAAEKELKLLTIGIKNALRALSRVTYDYSVWTATYEFMQDVNQRYIDENVIEDTFQSLKIDGIFYLDQALVPIMAKGVDHLTSKPLHFSFYDINVHPLNASLLPDPITSQGTPHQEGFINTLHGPALYSAFQVRDSNQKGNNRGYLIFIQLIEKEFLTTLRESTLTDIALITDINPPLKGVVEWDKKVKVETIKSSHQMLFKDMNNQPVALLSVQHRMSESPPLINLHSLLFIFILSLFTYLFYHLITHTIIKPVRSLAKSIQLIDKDGDCKIVSEAFSVKELIVVSQNINKLLNRVQQQNIQLKEQASTDQLTQVLNRHGLSSALTVHKNLCIRQKISFVVVMCDIDYFKEYNDYLGHLEGDNALYRVAQTLNKLCKRSTDHCARYGGEEFTLLFSGMNKHSLILKLQDIKAEINKLNIVHPMEGGSEHITISCGATIIHAENMSNTELPEWEVLRFADQALYQAKSLGRNQFVINDFILPDNQ
ncbi:diguanylate cyclase [Psychromonas sp. 14N.309.X.WAT.B.A12]|uniref:sensor domain-containing diguanylate cyclase n=1 Tax=Psychromonas sp. 14N.309.X.WAT.B.A12 TaxID=2998322 RepID=UPI0025B23B01|nr:diguanylate cyclase [Psychromonas sp. 14N.309.X.WAT.B.A12]MDN2663046.1 diguanylate cyclase [Psychromonas sp. 14N.309.X.WAT.B.A12]